MEKKQVFCLSVLGKPVTKKRARIFRNGGRVTPDMWYENMLGDAFVEAYPDADPIGHSFCHPNIDPDEWEWELKGSREGEKKVRGIDRLLPKVRIFMIFYFDSGKLGDADNYMKAVKDGLKGYAWIDDRQVKFAPPWVILDPDEESRVDILITGNYDERNDKLFQFIRSIMKTKAKVVDLREEYGYFD